MCARRCAFECMVVCTGKGVVMRGLAVPYVAWNALPSCLLQEAPLPPSQLTPAPPKAAAWGLSGSARSVSPKSLSRKGQVPFASAPTLSPLEGDAFSSSLSQTRAF